MLRAVLQPQRANEVRVAPVRGVHHRWVGARDRYWCENVCAEGDGAAGPHEAEERVRVVAKLRLDAGVLME